MPVYSGRGTAIGIGLESVYGTAVARTAWVKAVSWSMNRDISVEYSPELAQPNSGGDYSDVYDGQETAGGDIEVLLKYGDIGVLIYALMGGTPAEGGSGPDGYTHTFTLADFQPSLTIEGILGSSGNSEVFEGCKFSSATLSFAVGEPARFKASIIAETGAARGAAGAPSYGAASKVMGYHLGKLGFNAGSYSIMAVEIGVDRKLARLDELGSQQTVEPVPTGFTEVTLKATLNYRSDALYAAALAGTQGDVTFTATSATKSWAFTLNNARVRKASNPITQAGVVEQTVEWTGLADAGAKSLVAVLTNSNALYST